MRKISRHLKKKQKWKFASTKNHFQKLIGGLFSPSKANTNLILIPHYTREQIYKAVEDEEKKIGVNARLYVKCIHLRNIVKNVKITDLKYEYIPTDSLLKTVFMEKKKKK